MCVASAWKIFSRKLYVAKVWIYIYYAYILKSCINLRISLYRWHTHKYISGWLTFGRLVFAKKNQSHKYARKSLFIRMIGIDNFMRKSAQN